MPSIFAVISPEMCEVASVGRASALVAVCPPEAFMSVQRVIGTKERYVLLSFNYFLPYCLP